MFQTFRATTLNKTRIAEGEVIFQFAVLDLGKSRKSTGHFYLPEISDNSGNFT